MWNGGIGIGTTRLGPVFRSGSGTLNVLNLDSVVYWLEYCTGTGEMTDTNPQQTMKSTRLQPAILSQPDLPHRGAVRDESGRKITM